MRPAQTLPSDPEPVAQALRPTAESPSALLAAGQLGSRLLRMAQAAAAVHMAQAALSPAPDGRSNE